MCGKNVLDERCIICGEEVGEMNILLVCRDCGAVLHKSSFDLRSEGVNTFYELTALDKYEPIYCQCGGVLFDTAKDDVCYLCSLKHSYLYQQAL